MRPGSPTNNGQVVTDPKVSGRILGQRLRRKAFESVRRSVAKRLIPLQSAQLPGFVMTSKAENEPKSAISGFEHGTDPERADGISG
jgi:hypothetical protein